MKVLEELVTEGAKMRLKINEEKTKMMGIDKECKKEDPDRRVRL